MNNFKLYLGILIITGFFCSAKNATAETQQYGYRVTSSDKTLIQIARDVYQDERLWKIISQWNNLTPPYALKAGQILVLPFPPVTPVPAENTVAAHSIPAPVFIRKLPSVAQQLTELGGEFTYTVNERAPSLSMVALENYGNKKMGAVIAKWNGLSPQAKLSLGQTLKLKLQPRFNPAEAQTVLVAQWKRMGNTEMIARLNNKSAGFSSSFVKKSAAAVLPRAPVVFDPDSKRQPAAVPEFYPKAEPPAQLNSEPSWSGDKNSNSIEALIQAISN